MKNHVRNNGSSPRFVRHLAEAIILQSIEDLWDEGQRKDCLRFFRGNAFTICAEIAGLSVSAQGRLLGLIEINSTDDRVSQRSSEGDKY